MPVMPLMSEDESPEKSLVRMRVFLPRGRQSLVNPKTERVFQIRQLKN
jgi:hypothetical protein